MPVTHTVSERVLGMKKRKDLMKKTSYHRIKKEKGRERKDLRKKTRYHRIKKEERRERKNLTKKTSYHRIKKGRAFDIIDLLSTKDRDYLVSAKDGRKFPISRLNNKYVLVCCFTCPSDRSHLQFATWQALQALYSEHTRICQHPPYKLVLILNFEDEGEDKDAFDSFFHILSLDCLTVPFSDSDSRRLINDSLNPSSYGTSVLALDPNGLVLQHSNSLFLLNYGAQSFPFTDTHFAAIDKYTRDLRLQFTSRCSPVTLPYLLQCDSLCTIGSENESVSTFSLEDKTVGLYLYFDGARMAPFHDIYKQCLENHNELQIVLVPLAFDSLDPDSFSNQMKQSALKLGSTSSWLAFPFNDKMCRTLWRISEQLFEDELLIMPCGDRPGEVEAKFMVREYGISAYPFTRDAIVNKKVEQLRSRTLESLLEDANIHNKKVLFYFVGNKGIFYKMMEENCAKIKDRYPDALLYVAPLERRLCFKYDLSNLDMEKMSYDKCRSVIKHVFKSEDYFHDYARESLVAFGEDGKILSRLANLRFPLYEFSSASVFEDTLHRQILADLEYEIHQLI